MNVEATTQKKPTIYGKIKGNQNVPLKTIFFANSGGYSSKRILGFIGFLVCCVIFVIGFALAKEIPDYGEVLLITSASLVGLDQVTGIWNKTVTQNK